MSVFNNVKQLKENNFFIFIPRSNKLEPIKTNFYVKLEDLLEINYQKDVVLKNTKNYYGKIVKRNMILFISTTHVMMVLVTIIKN